MNAPATYPIDVVRQLFPATRRTHNGMPVGYFDGPGGSQVVGTCADAIAEYMRRGSGNLHGQFATSIETEAAILAARVALGDLLNADPEAIAIGPNSTTLLFHLSRALGRNWKPGDEIVVTELDHRGNVDTWLAQAEDKGVTVRWIKVDLDTFTLDLSDLDTVINSRTKLVAVGLASNAVGTINDVAKVIARAKAVGALSVVDAVQAVPHFAVDFRAMGADVLACSAYKFFGPHLGVLAIRPDLFEGLKVYKLVPAPDCKPDKLETGTLNHECISGIPAAVDFIASLGQGATRRERILAGYERIEAHENGLADKIRAALAGLPGLRLYQAGPEVPKTPTVAFTIKGIAPVDACKRIIDEAAVFVADGNFYAWTLAERLGINPTGGWVRAGLSPYNTEDEADRFIAAVTRLCR